MPRPKIKKLLTYLLVVVSCLFFMRNIYHRTAEIESLSETDDVSGKVGPISKSLLISRNTLHYEDDKRIPEPEKRPWYMKGGKRMPTLQDERRRSDVSIFPDNNFPGHDRMYEQLMLAPKPENLDDTNVPLKKILLWHGIRSGFGWKKEGRDDFINADECPVNTCTISGSQADAEEADLVLFHGHFSQPKFSRPTNQLWIMYFLESPHNTQTIYPKDVFNWTATYRTDSTIVAPYGRWQYYNENVQQLPLKQNYGKDKTKNVAWFVSNCNTRNKRLQYAKELGKYIDVDIYGNCGTKNCPRSQSADCFKMLEDYRFYLSFENSNCKDYITEKFFQNGLGHNVIPIVMGARPEDYERAAPHNSYIHVDNFDGPKQLADYLKTLEENDDLYNEYFRWKGTGEMINTKFFCRLCALLHEPTSFIPGHHYEDFNDWWRGEGTCIDGSWKQYDTSLRNNKDDISLTETKNTNKDCNDKECKAEKNPKLPQTKSR